VFPSPLRFSRQNREGRKPVGGSFKFAVCPIRNKDCHSLFILGKQVGDGRQLLSKNPRVIPAASMYTPTMCPSGLMPFARLKLRQARRMELAISGDLTHEVTPLVDLAFMLLKDIGWN
jgi:hypothetical protein